MRVESLKLNNNYKKNKEMATKDRTALKDEFKNGNLATGERFADLIDSMKVVQLPVVDPQALGTSLSFIDSISQDADGKITATKKTLDLANAHELNPFKGWYKTGDTLPTDGFDGAYLYFKDTSEQTGLTTIYRWNGTTYAPTGTVVDTSNVQTFGSGQQVNSVKIKDENGDEDAGAEGVLSAEAGKEIGETIYTETRNYVGTILSGYYYSSGAYQSYPDNKCTSKIAVEEGDKIYVKTYIKHHNYTKYMPYWNGDTYIGTLIATPDDSVTTPTEYEHVFVIPSGVTHIAVTSCNQAQPIVKKITYDCKFTPKSDVLELMPKHEDELELTWSNTDVRLSYLGVGTSLATSTDSWVSGFIRISSDNKYLVKTRIHKTYDAGVAYYSSADLSSFIRYDDSFVFGSGSNDTIEAVLSIPPNANYMLIGTRNRDIPKVSVVEYSPAASNEDLTGVEEQLGNKVDKEEGKGLSENDFSDHYKEILDGWEGGVFPSGVIEDAVDDYIENNDGNLVLKNKGLNVEESITINVDTDVFDSNDVTLGNGWSESDGVYTDAVNKTAPLEVDLSNAGFVTDDKILVTIQTSGWSIGVDLYANYGSLPKVRMYNGGDGTQYYGFIYDSTQTQTLYFTPTSGFHGNISSIKIQKLISSGGESITLTENNIYCLRESLVYGFWNIFVGVKNKTANKMQCGSRNIALGYSALGDMKAGNRNVCLGTFAGSHLIDGECNVAVGADTLYMVRHAENCVAIGENTLTNIHTNYKAIDSIAIGSFAMGRADISVEYNKENCVCIGVFAGTYTVKNCTYIGSHAGNNTTGAAQNNVAVGTFAFCKSNLPTSTSYSITGSNNTCVGYKATVNWDTAYSANNSIALGANTTITKSNQVVIGDNAVSEILLGGGNTGTVELILGTKKLVLTDDGNGNNIVTWEEISNE